MAIGKIIAGVLLVLATGVVSAAERIALVIGNQNYRQAGAGLQRPIADANSIAQALKQHQFQLMDNRIHQDLGKQQLEQLIGRFAQQARGAQVAVVYYAGHGVQDKRANYLIPVDAQINDVVDARYKGVDLGYVLEKLEGAGARLNLVFLDACRDNPFGGGRTLSRGLARVTPPGNSETLISYATSEGNTAADQSPYTPALVNLLQRQAHLPLEIMMRELGKAVKQKTGNRQRPDYTSSITTSFCFGDCGGTSPPPKPGNNVPEPQTTLIRGGSFMMGSPANEAGREDDEKQHEVTVTDFYMAQHEVNVGQFRRFVQMSGYKTEAEKDTGKGCYGLKVDKSGYDWIANRSWLNPGFPQDNSHPVVCVSWNDAVAYADWLSQQTGKQFRLPTEAEWEYAARAGTTTARYWGDDADKACHYENVTDQKAKQSINFESIHACNDNVVYTAPTGNYQPNSNGLHDVLGNVGEWTCSAYVKAYDGSERQCVKGGDSRVRVLRGGSWGLKPRDVRSAYRLYGQPSSRYYYIGFRLSRTP